MLRDLGYVEGKNIAFEYRFADNKLDRLPALADELVRLKVDVLVTPGTNEALAAKNATRTIPIVFMIRLIPLHLGWLTAWRGPAETSPGSPTLQRCWLANDWSYSRKPFPSSPALRCFGILRIQALRKYGKKANCRHENWVCSFIPWKSAAQTDMRAPSKKRPRRVASHSLDINRYSKAMFLPSTWPNARSIRGMISCPPADVGRAPSQPNLCTFVCCCA